MKKLLENRKGITLIALVITVIVLLILAGVTIAILTGDNGILTQANNARQETEISREKEVINLALTAAKTKVNGENFTKKELQEQLDNIEGQRKTEVYDYIEKYQIYFKESRRYYEIDKDGNVENIQVTNGEKILKVKCINSNNKVLGEYEYKILNDNYLIEAPVIKGYQSINEKINGYTTENIEVIQKYYLVLQDDNFLNFAPIDNVGNVVEDLKLAVAYTVTGLKNSINEEAILIIEDLYNGLPITRIKANSFSGISKLKIIEFGKNILNIGSYAFINCFGIEKIVICNGDTLALNNAMDNAFRGCNNWIYLEMKDNNQDYIVENNVLYTANGKELIAVPKGIKGTIEIKEKTQVIRTWAFRETNISYINIPESVTNIQGNAFVGSKIQTLQLGKNVNYIGSYAFSSCWNLRKVIAENPKVLTTTSSLDTGFRGCNNWTELAINDNNEEYIVKDNIMYSLDFKTLFLIPVGRSKKIEIDERTESIYNRAGYECSQITEINIPSNVSSIGTQFFYTKCSALTTVILDSELITKSITSISSNGGLIYCATTIYIKDTITEIGTYLESNYTRQSTTDREGYIKYTKN